MQKQAKITYAKIEKLEALLATQPSILQPVEHEFIDGLYARTMRVPGGSIITGAIHASENFLVVREGKGVIGTIDGLKWFKAGDMLISKAGAKNFAYIKDATIFTTFHANPENDIDPEILWEKYTVLPEELEHIVHLQLEGQ